MEYHSGIFSMRKGEFAKSMVVHYGIPWIAVMSMLSIPCLLLGILHDLRWIIIFLMLIFLLAPMLMAFLYFYHGLRPVNCINVVHHDINFLEEEVRINVYRLSEDEKYTRLYSKVIPHTLIKKLIPSQNGIYIEVNKPERGYIWLPINSFQTVKEMKIAVDTIQMKS